MSYPEEYYKELKETRTAVFTREEVARLYDKGLVSQNMIEPLLRLSFEKGELCRPPHDDLDITMEYIWWLKEALR